MKCQWFYLQQWRYRRLQREKEAKDKLQKNDTTSS